MKAFRAAVEARDVEAMTALLAEDVVFRSPVAHKPYPGKAITASILAEVMEVFSDFRYVTEIGDEDGRDHALVFEAGVGDKAPDRLRLHPSGRGRADRRLHGDGAPALGCPGSGRRDGRPVRQHRRPRHHRCG